MSQKPKSRFRIPNAIFRLMWTGQFKPKECAHLDLIRVAAPDTDVCRECVATGDTPPGLRMCMICGYTGCCDKSKNRHSLKHYEETGHPLIRAIGPGEDWIWCRIDNALLDVPRGLEY